MSNKKKNKEKRYVNIIRAVDSIALAYAIIFSI